MNGLIAEIDGAVLNATAAGSDMLFLPASRKAIVQAIESGELMSIWENTHGVGFAVSEEAFYEKLYRRFEELFDPDDAANVAWWAEDGNREPSFDWYGENFYSMESTQRFLEELRSMPEEDGFYAAFCRVLSALIERACELEAERGAEGDWGLRIVGP